MVKKSEKTVRENSEPSQEALLINEFQSLRKGRGLTQWKLANATTLRSIIAEHTGIERDDLASSQVQDFLFHELEKLGESIEARATRNAFAIGLEHNPHNLMQRRADFSGLVGRHSDTIEAYENSGIKEIVSRLLNFGPALSQQTNNKPSGMEGIYGERFARAAHNMVIQGLSDLYGLDEHAPEILRGFGRTHHPYLDADVEIALLPHLNDSKRCIYQLRYTFRASKTNYRVAIVSSVHDEQILMASGVVDEVLGIDVGIGGTLQVNDALNKCFFIVHDTITGTQESFTFAELDDVARTEVLEPVWQIDPTSCRIIEVKIPKSSMKEMNIYEFRYSIDISLQEQYAYWYAPRLMYVKNITVDVSRFPNRQQRRFSVQPFLGHILPTALEPAGDRYSLSPNSWLMPGHGIAVMWQ